MPMLDDLTYDQIHDLCDEENGLDLNFDNEQEEENSVAYTESEGNRSFDEKGPSWLTWENAKKAMLWYLDSFTIKLTFDDFMMILTIFVLFGSDLKQLAVDNKHDDVFDVLFIIALACFSFELIVTTLAKTDFSSLKYIPYAPPGPPPRGHSPWSEYLRFLPHFPKITVEGYLFSFFWFLDVLSILSLFTDISVIAIPLGINGSVTGSSTVTKAGRVVRLVRLVRLLRLYKIFVEKRKKIKEERRLMKLVRSGQIAYHEMAAHRALNDLRRSRLSTQLSTAIIRKVIVMILIMLICLPLLQYVGKGDQSTEFAVKMLHKFNINNTISDASKSAMLNATSKYTKENWMPNGFFLKLEMDPFAPDFPVYKPHAIADTRDKYLVRVTKTLNTITTSYKTSATATKKIFAQEDAIYSICLTVFVGFMIVLGAWVFTSDAEQNVLKPIERMTKMVEQVAANPLAPLIVSHLNDDNGGQYETKLLEAALSKLTGLLSVGFGEAGAGIISANLLDTSATIDPLLPGIRVYALFGFCDIHRFEEVNNKLGNDVLVFVNTIAEIVHSSVHSWGGQCNKNLGNAFVLIWRVGDEEQLMRANDMSIMARKKRASSVSEYVAGQAYQDVSSVGIAGTASSRTPFSPAGSSAIGSPASPAAPASETSGKLHRSESFSESAANQVNTAGPQAMDLRRVPGVDVIAHGALIGFLKIVAEINRSTSVLAYRVEDRLTRLPPGDSDGKFFKGGSANPMAMPGTLHLHFTETRAAMRKTKAAAAEAILLLEKGAEINESIIENMLEDWEIAVIAKKEKQEAALSAQERAAAAEKAAAEKAAEKAAKEEKKLQMKEQKARERLESGHDSGKDSEDDDDDDDEEAELHEEFRVRMGFGLHAGWAIEGAVGSLFKVDATYLSPHVNMAARLETSSRQYGVPLLMSHVVHELLAPEVQSRCRKLDVVTVKGSEVPVGVYTYDCFQDQLFLNTNANLTAPKGGAKRRDSLRSQESGKSAKRRDSLRSQESNKSSKRRDSLQSQDSVQSGSGKNQRRDSLKSDGSTDSRPGSPPPPPPETTLPPLSPLMIGSPGSPGSSTLGTPVSFLSRKRLESSDLKLTANTGSGKLSNFFGDSPTQYTSNPAASVRLPRPSTPSGLKSPQKLLLNRVYADVANKICFAKPELLTNQDSANIFKYDMDLLQLRAHVAKNDEFSRIFNLGVEAYIKGQWGKAHTFLKESNELMKSIQRDVMSSNVFCKPIDFKALRRKLRRSSGVSRVSSGSGQGKSSPHAVKPIDESLVTGDGPSQTLLAYIEARNKKAPEDWMGYRPLTSK